MPARPTLTALLDRDARVLRSPAVGIWRDAPEPGSLIRPGSDIGQLAILGALYRLQAPKGAYGLAATVATDDADDSRDSNERLRPVGHGDPLLSLDLEGLGAQAAHGPAADGVEAAASAGELAFRAPMSGRYYRRPSPDQAPFVEVGQDIQFGATVGLLEVMKTFNRVTYGGDELPERAVVVEIVPEDQADIAAGDVILRLRRP